MTGRRAETDAKTCACGQTFSTWGDLYDHTEAALLVTPDSTADHPHRVTLRKDQLLRHVTTPHPFGFAHESGSELKLWTAQRLKRMHRRLHEGRES